ncbi:MAG: Gx transporter family protein [Oscillospiraceae bacterium]|nr:Gx transporter family protein [Oscillospiraceae bacterium]
MKTKRLALLSMAAALAMILSYLESMIPAFVAIPGIKMGLANIAVVFVLYELGWKEAAAISLVRVIVVSLVFTSNPSTLFYSSAGAVLSLLGMIGMKKTGLFSTVAVSVTGGVLHNVGQIGMACILLETDVVRYYLPYLILSGTLAGIAIGVAAAILIKRIDIRPKN